MSLKDYLIKPIKISDPRGNLGIIEAERNIPFPIRRVYYIYGVPQHVERGGHAHKALQQLIIPVAGSFEMMLDDGKHTAHYTLDDPSIGLHIDTMIWHEMKNFSKDAVGLVLASDYYDENDYYRDYQDFQASVVGQST
ncbi:MAG: FdtA/QdtA family cupin domain-containing protein [Gammaproteobacteria bacterium]